MEQDKKNAYAIDEANRLVLKRPDSDLPLDGRFEIDKENQLNFWLNETEVMRRDYGLEQKLKFKGKWELDANYDFTFTCTQLSDEVDKKFTFKGEIIAVEKDTLVFEIRTLDKDGQSHLQILKFSGVWQADAFNRINFVIEKKIENDTLTFTGIWQINPFQQVTYTYEKRDLKTKTKILHTLTFNGFWEINAKNRVSYIISRSPDSRFDFRVQLESPNLYPKSGVIKYRLGVGVAEEGLYEEKVMALYGTWKFQRKAGLVFEMDYGQAGLRQLEFGVNVSFADKEEVAFSLVNKIKEDLGLKITFSRRFFKTREAEMFLRLRSKRDESGIDGGLRCPF